MVPRAIRAGQRYPGGCYPPGARQPGRYQPGTGGRRRTAYDALWDKQPPRTTSRERSAAAAHQEHAQRHGWPPLTTPGRRTAGSAVRGRHAGGRTGRGSEFVRESAATAWRPTPRWPCVSASRGTGWIRRWSGPGAARPWPTGKQANGQGVKNTGDQRHAEWCEA